MPSNFTENYQLSQWEASDDVLRADFNADNAKIDAALAAKCEIVTGTYVGDGTASQEIVLGRRPKAVYLCRSDGTVQRSYEYVGGLTLSDSTLCMKAGHPMVEITDNGFNVFCSRDGSFTVQSNGANYKHHYIAFF